MSEHLKPTRTSEDALEWSRSCRDWQHTSDKPRRLFVEIQDDTSGITITEAEVTSESDSARMLAGGHRGGLVLTGEELLWLRAVLEAVDAERQRLGWPS